MLTFLSSIIATFSRINSNDSYALTRILRLIKDPEITAWQLREHIATAAAYSSVRVAREILACPNFKQNLDYASVIIASASNCNTTSTEFFLENIPNLRNEKTWYLMKKTGSHCGDSYKVDFIKQMRDRFGTKIDPQ
jgi:hypothetical protein